MGLRAAIVAMTSVLALAACGGSNNGASVPVAPTTGSAPTTTTTSTATTPLTPTAPANSTTSNSTAGPPPCRTADLALSYLGQEGATGHGEIGFALRNISGHQCRTYGYPGILFLDKAGNPLPTKPTHTTVDFFGNTTETELVVLPGAYVSFRLGVSHGAASPTGCTTAYGLQVIAPDDTHTTRTTIPQGAAECEGTATVSPLQASTLAFGH